MYHSIINKGFEKKKPSEELQPLPESYKEPLAYVSIQQTNPELNTEISKNLD